MKNQLHRLWESLPNGSSPYFKLSNYTLSNIYYWWKAKFTLLNKSTVERMLDRAVECPECWENGDCLQCGCDVFDMFKAGKPCKIDDDIKRQWHNYTDSILSTEKIPK